MPSPTESIVSQLARLIGTPEAPVLIDVSMDEDFSLDPSLIPTTFRFSFGDIKVLASRLKRRRVVVYCHKGLKRSQGVAAILRDCGTAAEKLEGGHPGWREAERETVWVTRHRPKIDRAAGPELMQ